LLAQQSRSDEAFRLLEDWVARAPRSSDPKIELARLTEEFGDGEAAKHYLFDALQIEPRNARALAALGRLREDEGDMAQALANYQRSLESNPHQPELARRMTNLNQQVARGTTSGSPPDSRLATTPANDVR
jgi:tetratricopeptide (TPR) repeat protein